MNNFDALNDMNLSWNNKIFNHVEYEMFWSNIYAIFRAVNFEKREFPKFISHLNRIPELEIFFLGNG